MLRRMEKLFFHFKTAFNKGEGESHKLIFLHSLSFVTWSVSLDHNTPTRTGNAMYNCNVSIRELTDWLTCFWKTFITQVKIHKSVFSFLYRKVETCTVFASFRFCFYDALMILYQFFKNKNVLSANFANFKLNLKILLNVLKI